MFNNILKNTWSRLTGTNISRLQSFERQQAKFKKRYPNYTIGTASYGMPVVHDNHGQATLKIGAYCSIASNVQIFLGGQHCINWVSSYPFPFFFQMNAAFREMSLEADGRGDVIIGSDVWACANALFYLALLSGMVL